MTPRSHTAPARSRRPHAPRSWAAFTLIELLVVIAILSLLAAILFPVFAKARSKARQAACQSNLKQIGAAVLLYMQDFDGTYIPKYNCRAFSAEHPDHCESPRLDVATYGIVPDAPLWLPAPEAPAGTEYLLRPYLKNDDVRRCPARTPGPPPAPGGPPTEGRYVLNGWDTSYSEGRPETSPQGRADAAVPEPAGTLLAWEHTNPAGECQVGQVGGSGDQLGPDFAGHLETGHAGGFNALYCDGHVKRLLQTQLRRPMFTIQTD